MGFWSNVKNLLYPGSVPDSYHPPSGAYQTDTGLSFTSETAQNVSAVISCIRLLAETISTLPVEVYRLDEQQKTLAPGLPNYELITRTPSGLYPASTFYRSIVWMLNTRGNCYALIERGNGMRIERLTLVDPALIRIFLIEGQVWYKHDRREEMIPASDMLHFHILSEDGLVGVSPLARAKSAIGLSIAEEKFGSQLFERGANVSGLVSVQGRTNKEQREAIRESVQSLYAGSANQQKTMVLDNGATFHRMSLTPEDSQFLGSRKFQLEEIARVFRVPPAMIAGESPTYSNYEQQINSFMQDTVRPLVVAIEDELERKLYPGESGVSIEFNLDARLRADTATRAAFYTVMRQSGVMTKDEVRRREGLPPLTPEQKAELEQEQQQVMSYQGQGAPRPEPEPEPELSDEERMILNGYHR